jgi:hypothetical protein
LQLGELLPAALAECVTHTGTSIKLDEHHPFVLFLYQEVRVQHTLDDPHPHTSHLAWHTKARARNYADRLKARSLHHTHTPCV